MHLLDIMTVSDHGTHHVFVVSDYFTKYTDAYTLARKMAASVVKMFMEQWVMHFVFLLVVHFDQGCEFDSTLLQCPRVRWGFPTKQGQHLPIPDLMVSLRDISGCVSPCSRCLLTRSLSGTICYCMS